MTIAQIISLLEATSLSDTPDLEHTIESVCGSDMMSDVLAFIKKDALLLTGLNNLQVIRTAEMLDIVCLVLPRNTLCLMPAAFYIMPDYGEEAETMPSIHYQYTVDGDDFTLAGEASSALKQTLKLMNLDADIIRRCAIAMYEGEINMVIHANGGIIDVDIFPDKIVMVLTDHGPGIPDVPLAMQEGYSTAGEEVLNLGFGAGMGLPNMKRSSDEMHIDTSIGVGTTVTMTIYIRTI